MVLYYVLYFIIFIYVFNVSKRSLHMLQQNLYNENNRYLKWVWQNRDIFLDSVDVFGIVLALILTVNLNLLIKDVIVVIITLVYIGAYFSYLKSKKTDQNKKPLVVTKRIRRLIVTLLILYLIPVVVSVFNHDWVYICIIILTFMVTFNFYIVFIAMIINFPIEKCVGLYYRCSAEKKLKSMPNLKVVGITGSYGKTSSKNILASILNIKYNALPTPKSLNTYNGLMMTINNKLSKFDDVFIAEMGAYVRGDIEQLCDLVKPKYGIITTIGTAHLKTFGSEQNIVKGKMELIESLPSDGVGVLNKDDPKQVSYKIKNHCKILWVAIDDKTADVVASDIKCSSSGTSFNVTFKGNKTKYKFETKLLGAHNVYNILDAIALGKEFGMDIKDLQLGVRKVRPVEHRLELKRLGSYYQIDDAYNSNPVGAKMALEVLSMFDGDKVVVTPGMIELGDKEDYYNKEFGKQISEVADKVILIGKNKTKPIYDGLIESGYKEDNIIISNDVKEAYLILNRLVNEKNLYALFENDLPDTYTEK